MDVTLRDVARRAAVSTSTVSRVLNDYPHVGEAARAAVKQAAEELGYPLGNLRRASAPARAVLLSGGSGWSGHPRAGYAGQIGTREFQQRVLDGAQPVLEAHGLAARLGAIGKGLDDIRRYAEDPGVAGMIFMGGDHDRDFLRDLQRAGLPFVAAGGHALPLHVNCVMADIARGLEGAVAHLVAAGRRTIGLVNGGPFTTTSEEKFKGFRLALSLHDLAFSPDHVEAGDFTPEVGYERTRELLARLPALDAIVYADDFLAMGGLRALKERGRRVPDDVAAIGFHDYEITRFTDPPLTSVGFDMRAIGALAARRLCLLLAEPDEQPWLTLVPTTLIVRESA